MGTIWPWSQGCPINLRSSKCVLLTVKPAKGAGTWIRRIMAFIPYEWQFKTPLEKKRAGKGKNTGLENTLMQIGAIERGRKLPAPQKTGAQPEPSCFPFQFFPPLLPLSPFISKKRLWVRSRSPWIFYGIFFSLSLSILKCPLFLLLTKWVMIQQDKGNFPTVPSGPFFQICSTMDQMEQFRQIYQEL